MQYLRLAHLFALATLTQVLDAVPTSPPSSPKQVYYDDSFENLQANPANDDVNFVDNHAGGALLYNAFAVGQTDPLVLKTNEGTKSIFSQEVQQTIEGQPGFYINNTISSFDLQSVDYAIALNTQNGVVAKVQTGTIQLSGKKTDGSTVVYELVYNETLLTVAGTFATAKLPPTFTYLTRVDIDLIQAQTVTSPLVSTIFFDSVKYLARFAK